MRESLGELAEWLTKTEGLERPQDGPEGVRYEVPNNACPCMVRRTIEQREKV